MLLCVVNAPLNIFPFCFHCIYSCSLSIYPCHAPLPPLPRPRKYFIPKPTAKGDQSAQEEIEGETLNKHWLVKDIMDFENIGFTFVRGTIRYLACADCEVGPVGWHDISNKKEYYLTAARVQYSDK